MRYYEPVENVEKHFLDMGEIPKRKSSYKSVQKRISSKKGLRPNKE